MEDEDEAEATGAGVGADCDLGADDEEEEEEGLRGVVPGGISFEPSGRSIASLLSAIFKYKHYSSTEPLLLQIQLTEAKQSNSQCQCPSRHP